MRAYRSFFARGAREVAIDLLGMSLNRTLGDDVLSGIIIETGAHEMLVGIKKMPKTEGAFRSPGLIHMYSAQGKYTLAISTGREGAYSEISIVGLYPTRGLEIMKERRGTRDIKELTNGPSKITEALQIGREFDGKQIYDNPELWIEGKPAKKEKIVPSGREKKSADCLGYFRLIL